MVSKILRGVALPCQWRCHTRASLNSTGCQRVALVWHPAWFPQLVIRWPTRSNWQLTADPPIWRDLGIWHKPIPSSKSCAPLSYASYGPIVLLSSFLSTDNCGSLCIVDHHDMSAKRPRLVSPVRYNRLPIPETDLDTSFSYHETLYPRLIPSKMSFAFLSCCL